jgi:hypothetical protein
VFDRNQSQAFVPKSSCLFLAAADRLSEKLDSMTLISAWRRWRGIAESSERQENFIIVRASAAFQRDGGGYDRAVSGGIERAVALAACWLAQHRGNSTSVVLANEMYAHERSQQKSKRQRSRPKHVIDNWRENRRVVSYGKSICLSKIQGEL